MQELNVSPPPLASNVHPETASGCARRLMVLIPYGMGYSAATRRIRELANEPGTSVLLLGIWTEPAGEPGLRRELTILAGLLQNEGIEVEVRVDPRTNCLTWLRSNYRPGDAIVWPAGQHAGLLRGPLNEILSSDLNATIYVLSGAHPGKSGLHSRSQILAWLGSIAIVLVFGILQAYIVQLPEGWLQSVLLIHSIIPEFWLIWAWNGRWVR